MADSKSLNRLQSFFKIGFKPNAQLDNDKVFPLKTNRVQLDNKSDMLKFTKQKFSDETQRLYNHWLDNTYDPAKSFTNRLALYDDMDVLYFNSPYIARAIELVADETIQADTNDQPIFIDAKRPVKKYI